MRYANKKDESHATIVDGLRLRGVVVLDMPKPGDVLTYQPLTRRWTPLEIKTADAGRETESQRQRREGHRIRARRSDGSRYYIDVPASPIPVVETLEEALRAIGL